MASTPSAPALSAVLRCRGNIWTRNPPTKRPAPSVYSLGAAGEVICDSPTERRGSNEASAWEAFLRGGPVVVGKKRLTVAIKSPQVEGNKLCHPKVLPSPADAHAVPGGTAPACQLPRSVTSHLPGIDSYSHIIQKIKPETNTTQVYKIVFVHEIGEFPAGVLKVSIVSPCWMENAEQIPPFVFSGWSTLRSTCLSLTALVSQLMFLKLAVLSRSSSSPDDAPPHLLSQEDERSKTNALQVSLILTLESQPALRVQHSCQATSKSLLPILYFSFQANVQICSSTDPITTNSGSVQKVTEDRPD